MMVLFIEDDDDIHKIGKVYKDFHRVNKQSYHFQIHYDSSNGYYSTRLGVNVGLFTNRVLYFMF